MTPPAKRWSTPSSELQVTPGCAIAAPHRFRHLSWTQLCDERFRFEYAARLGRFFVSLDLTPGNYIDGYIHLAGALPLLPNLTRIRVTNYEGVFEVAQNRGHYHRSNSTYAVDLAKAADVKLLNTALDVSMVVAELDQVSERISAAALSRLERLSVEITTESFGGLIPFLISTPNLQSLELRLSGDAEETEVILNDLLTAYYEESQDIDIVLPSLVSLKLDYPDAEGYQPVRPEEPVVFTESFPVLTNLTLSGDIDALPGAQASGSDGLFPALRHLSHLPSVIVPYRPRRPDEENIVAHPREYTIDRVSVYNSVGPLQQGKPTLTLATNALLTTPPLYPNLLTYAAAPHPANIPFLERDLRKTLDFLRDWEKPEPSRAHSSPPPRAAKVMFFLKAAASALFYVTAVSAAPSVRNSIDLVARSQVTLPSGRTATSIVVEGDTDCGGAVGTNMAWTLAHGELYQMTVASSNQLLCEGRLTSYLTNTTTYQDAVDVAKRSLADQYGDAHVEKRWNPVLISFGAVELAGGSSLAGATITLGTVVIGWSLLAFAAATWWGFKYLLSGSATEKIGRRGLFARDSGAVFSNTTVVKVVAGQCTTSTCNGKTPGYTFYAGFSDYDSVGPQAQSISYDDDYDLTAQCLNLAHNSGLTNTYCKAWFEDNQGNYESVKLHYYLTPN
ncbi:hypothetical protein RHOSPDRAFT_35171 [Rhodotorula sp. JG-1b]|nr:hypothetical protein RHOSPDRAFT_35171 [Rhodotorula sp. JG-1b]